MGSNASKLFDNTGRPGRDQPSESFLPKPSSEALPFPQLASHIDSHRALCTLAATSLAAVAAASMRMTGWPSQTAPDKKSRAVSHFMSNANYYHQNYRAHQEWAMIPRISPHRRDRQRWTQLCWQLKGLSKPQRMTPWVPTWCVFPTHCSNPALRALLIINTFPKVTLKENSNQNELESPADIENNNANETQREIEGHGWGIVNNNSNINRVARGGAASPGDGAPAGAEGTLPLVRITNNNSNKNVVRWACRKKKAHQSPATVQ